METISEKSPIELLTEVGLTNQYVVIASPPENASTAVMELAKTLEANGNYYYPVLPYLNGYRQAGYIRCIFPEKYDFTYPNLPNALIIPFLSTMTSEEMLNQLIFYYSKRSWTPSGHRTMPNFGHTSQLRPSQLVQERPHKENLTTHV